MKNFKLLLVAAVVFGAGSAFTTSKDSSPKLNADGLATVNFVRVSGPSNSTSRTDYQYRPTNGCQGTSSATCKADWIQEDASPAVGANPQMDATFSAPTHQGSRVIQ